MNEAGLFAGEITILAPDDQTQTRKRVGYVWMQYGTKVEPPPP